MDDATPDWLVAAKQKVPAVADQYRGLTSVSCPVAPLPRIDGGHPSNSATAPCPDPSEKGSAPAGTMGTALAGPVTCHSRAGHSHPAVTSASDIGNNDFASMSAPPWQQQGQKPSNIGRSSPAPCTLPGVKQLQDGSATLITPCISPGVKRLQDSSAALITPARKLTKPPARCQPGTGKHPNEPHKKQRQGNRSKKGACPVTSPIGCGLGEKELMNVLYPSSENAIKAGSTPKLPRVTARSKGRSHNRKGGKGGTEPNLWHAGSSCLLPKLFDLELLKRPLLTSLRNNVEISASSPIEQAFISFGCMRRRVLNKIFSPQQPVNGAVPMETLKGEASTYPSKQACENTAARSGTLFELPNPSNNRDALRNAEIRRSESHALNVSRLQALQSELAAARRTVETLEGMVQEAEIAAGVHPGGSCEAAKARPDSSFGTGAAKPDTSFVDVPEARAQEHMSHQDSECISTDLISILDDSGDESDRWY
eukprot:gene13395-19246_t